MKTCEKCLEQGLETEMGLHEAGMSIVNRHSQYLLQCEICGVYCSSVDGKEFEYTYEFNDLNEEMKSVIKEWNEMWENHRKEVIRRLKAEDEIDFIDRMRKLVDSMEHPLQRSAIKNHDFIRLFETLEGKQKMCT